MAQPRRPKGESGPAKSSKHREKALETGLYQDDTRMSALESLLGTAAVSSASTTNKKDSSSSSKKKSSSSSKTTTGEGTVGSSSPKVGRKQTENTHHQQDATTGSTNNNITSEDILALLARIEKKSSGELQLLRSMNSLVSAYAVPKQQQHHQNEDDSASKMGKPESSTLSSSSSVATSASSSEKQQQQGAPDDIVVPTVSTFCDQLQLNAFHPNVVVRRGFATCLNHLLHRGSEVRQAVGASIAKTFAPWLCLIGDEVNSEVSRPAKEAMEKTFPRGSSKRAQLFSKFGARACKKILEDLAMFLTTRRADFAVVNQHQQQQGKSSTEENESSEQQQNQNSSAPIRDSGDTPAGIAVGQLFGALSVLVSELFSSSSSSPATSKKQDEESDDRKTFGAARKEVSVLLATALGFIENVDDDDDETMSRTQTSSTATFTQQQQQEALSFSQKKSKNNKKNKLHSGGFENKPAEGAAVFGSNYADPSNNNSGGSTTTSFFQVLSKKCLPSDDGTSGGVKPIISTSLRLQQKLWSLVGEIILFSCRALATSTTSSTKTSSSGKKTSSSSSTNATASSEFILTHLTKSMTAVLFESLEESSSSSSISVSVQQAFWSTLISTLQTLSVSASSSTDNNNNASFFDTAFFTSSIRKTLWPCVMDILDNVAEGDVQGIPVALFDALSSVILLLHKTSGNSFIQLSTSSGVNFLTSIFDKLAKITSRNFSAKRATNSSPFTTSMRALIEFTGTTLSIIFFDKVSFDTALALSSRCLKSLMQFTITLSTCVDDEVIIEEMKKLPANMMMSTMAISSSSSATNKSSPQDPKMLLDITDRLAGWTLLAAKNSSSAPEASKAVNEALETEVMGMTTKRETNETLSISSLVSLQVVKRWLNLDSSTEEMAAVALSQHLEKQFLSSLGGIEKLGFSYHQLLWFFRELANVAASSSSPIKLSKVLSVAQKINNERNFVSLVETTIKNGMSKLVVIKNNNNKTTSTTGATENEAKTFTRLALLLDNSHTFSTLANSIFSHTIKKNEKKDSILAVIECVSQTMTAVGRTTSSSSRSTSLTQALVSSLLQNFASDCVFVSKIVRKLLKNNNNNNNCTSSGPSSSSSAILSQLWTWIQNQADALVYAAAENNDDSEDQNSNVDVPLFESLLGLIQSLLSLSSSVEQEQGQKDEYSELALASLRSLSESCLIPLSRKSSSEDSFIFIPEELKEALDDDEFDEEEEEDEDEDYDDSDDDEEKKNTKKEDSNKKLSAEELRTRYNDKNQVFLRLFDSWASACEEIPGGSALIVDFAKELDDALSESTTDYSAHSPGHIALLGASLRARRFPSSLCDPVTTWKNLIEKENQEEKSNNNNDDDDDKNSSSSLSVSSALPNFFSLLSLLNSPTAKRFSVHDFAVAQFPAAQVIDFACEAGVSIDSLTFAGRLFVAFAEAIHATGFKTEVQKDEELERERRVQQQKEKKMNDDDEDDEEFEEEEEEEEEDESDFEQEEDEIVLKKQQPAANHQQQQASLPSPDPSIGTKLILPVMQMLSVRNLWTAKVRESLKYILSWCLECLLPSSKTSSTSGGSFLNSNAVAGLAQTCVSICVNFSERAPFLLTGPLALLAQMYTTTKDARYDRLLRAIYSSVANAWAMDVWRFSPSCFCPWPGSALDSLLWQALMPRGVSLPKEAIDKLRRSFSMSPAGAPSTFTQEQKNVKAIDNAIHAMYLLSLLPVNLASEAPTIEVNHVVQAMRSINMATRGSGASSSSRRQSVFLSGLAVFAALSRCVVLSSTALPEVAADAVNCLTQAYHLELLPPAGKFAFQQQQKEKQEENNSSSEQEQQSNNRKIIQALSALRHGVKARFYKDDGLISTMNLCVLDIGCSLGAKLQQYANAGNSSTVSYEEEQEQEAQEQRLLLVAFDVSKFLSSEFLSQEDLRILRASAATVEPIARFVIGTHFWLCARPLKLFAFDDFISKATTIVNLAAQLAVSILIGCRPLIKNHTIMSSLVQIFARPPLRPMQGRQHAMQELAQQEEEFNARQEKDQTEEIFMSERSKLARVLAVPQKQLSLTVFKRHTNFLMSNAKMRITGISFFVLSYVYLSLSDDPDVSSTLNGISVVQAADLLLCGLMLKDQDSGKQIYDSPLQSSSTAQRRKNHKNNANHSAGEYDQEDELMSHYLEISKIADPKWLQPAAKSPVVSAAQLRAQVGRWAATCLGLLIQRPVIVTLRLWRDSLHHTAAEALTTFINMHFSPYLSKMALFDVVSQAPAGELNTLMERQICSFHPPEEQGGDNITIEVDHDARTVTVKFQHDEVETKIAIRVPVGYPLSTAAISEKDIGIKGISEAKRRSWLLKMSASLLNGSASLWSAVELFCTNLTKEFEGVEPCPICFTITSGNELPSMQCKVCKNAKFHKSCLTQWWATSPQSICPMCRSPWFAA